MPTAHGTPRWKAAHPRLLLAVHPAPPFMCCCWQVVEKILDNPVLLVNTAPGKPTGGRDGVGSLGAAKPQEGGGCC